MASLRYAFLVRPLLRSCLPQVFRNNLFCPSLWILMFNVYLFADNDFRVAQDFVIYGVSF